VEVAFIDETPQTVISRFLRSWKGLEAIRFVAISIWGLVAKIDVPNIHIFPERYGVSNVVFKAGFRMAIGALTSYASQAQYRQEQRSRLSAQRAGFTNGGASLRLFGRWQECSVCEAKGAAAQRRGHFSPGDPSYA